MEEREKAVKINPVRFDNVVMEDCNSGLQLRGVFIRPEVWSVDGQIFFTELGSFLIITADETEKGQRMGFFIQREKLARVLAGEELIIKSHLSEEIDLEWEIYRAYEDVFSSSGGKFLSLSEFAERPT